MATLNLRAVAAATFVPAFPLLLAEGIVSHHAVPAVGLVPLAFSSGFSLFTLLRMRVQHRRRRHSSGSSSSSSSSSEDEDEEAACDSKHPIIYFVIDVVLAAALLIVLVFSWTKSDELSGKIAALAAYATIPLLINFLIHVYFSIVPAECPHCEHRIRPTSLPRIPWFHQARRIKLIPGTKGVKVPEFESSGGWFSKKREWQAPKWLRKRRDSDDHGGMFARHDDDEERYRDEPEHAGPSDRVVEPEEVQISGKIKKKVREGLFHHSSEEVIAESGPSTVVGQESEEVDAGDKFKQRVENFLHHGDETVEATPTVVVQKTEEVEVEQTIKQKVGHLLHHEDEPVESAPPAPVVPEVKDDETHETIKQKVDHLLHHEEEPAESAPAVATPKPVEAEPEAPETMKQKMDHLLHHDDESDSDKSSSK